MGDRASREEALATSLHSAALRLLRRLRLEDVGMGLGTARASVLSVLVFSGPKNVTELATLEQVRPPTMTRLLDRLERDGLVERRRTEDDRRSVRIHATPEGRRILQAGRARRVAAVARNLRDLTEAEIQSLERASPILMRIADRGPGRRP